MTNPTVLFAAGRGGDPIRHSTTLERLNRAGFDCLAPKFEMIAAHRPTEAELLTRVSQLAAAIDERSPAGPIVGIGHSIGATLLLAMAGAQIWLGPDRQLPISCDPRLDRLVLLAPPVGFFAAPGALERVALPMLVRVGSQDDITPPDVLRAFVSALAPQVEVDLEMVENADHFSFMDMLPPGKADVLPQGDVYRGRLVNQIVEFATR